MRRRWRESAQGRTRNDPGVGGDEHAERANMFVSTHDIDDAIPGIQNVWVQGVGCATAAVHFSS